MKAEKLKSGNWRVQLYIGTDETGKKRKKSFTAKTRREAEQMAARYKPEAAAPMVLAETVRKYIELKEPVLSPSTIRAYRTILRSYVEGSQIGRSVVTKLKPAMVQEWISCLVKTVTAKTARNALSLVSAAVAMYFPEVGISATVPQQMRRRLYSPTDADIAALLNAADGEMQKAILLGAFCGHRRGEICALSADDVDFPSARIFVTKAVVRGEGGYSVKPPKTEDSNRSVPVPLWVLDRLPKDGQLVDLTLAAVTTSFGRIVQKVGLPHFRVHDLRHFYATRLSYIGIPTKLICDMGGWRTDRVFKAHYEDVVSDELENGKIKVMDFFKKFETKSSHEVPTRGGATVKNA